MTKENGFTDWADAPYKNHFSIAYWGIDAKGNIIGAIASEQPLDKLDPNKELLILPFYHAASVLDNVGLDLMHYGGYSGFLQVLIQNAEANNPPYIQTQIQQ